MDWFFNISLWLKRRTPLIFSIMTVFTLLISLVQPQNTAYAAVSLTITPITWNVIGLDSNNVNVGPNNFPVGARVCNTGSTDATNVTSTFVWDSADPYINLRAGSITAFTGVNAVPTLTAGQCTDFYYEVQITRNAAAYNHVRRYHITASADGTGTISTPIPREIFVEHLVSQNRNTVDGIKVNGVLIPPGGGLSLTVGNTYEIQLIASTSTNGYNQVESYINFPNTLFQVLSVSTDYSVSDIGNPISMLYGDGCGWDNDPSSPYYRSCTGVEKVGGDITVTYQIKVISGGGSALSLNSLIYDFSGSSFHYNSDFSVSSVIANIYDPSTMTISKTFIPDQTYVGGTSTLSFVISNPNPSTMSGVAFTDTFPTTPGAMVVASTPGATTSGCGSPTFSPTPGAASISFSNGTIAAGSTCTIKVNVTVPVAGTYNNTTSSLTFTDPGGGTVDTGNTASDSLIASTSPPPTTTCDLARWTMETSQGTSVPPAYSYKDTTSRQPRLRVAMV